MGGASDDTESFKCTPRTYPTRQMALRRMSAFKLRIPCRVLAACDGCERHDFDGESTEAQETVQDIGAPVAVG